MFKMKNLKILLLLMLFAFAGNNAWAFGPKYHHWYRFQAEVKAQPTGAAKVYGAFPESNGSISYSENLFTSHKHFDNRTDEPIEGVSTGDLTAYLRYDNVADGYRFLHWIDSKGNIITAFNNTQQAYTATVTSDNLCYTGSSGTSGDSSGAQEHIASDKQHPYYTNETFTAVFERLTTEPAVSVSTEGAEDGQVSAKVSPEENAVGDEVTISTQVNSDASLQAWKNKFLGWKFNGEFIKDGQGNIIRDVSYTFTITEDNKGEYVAVYEGDYSFFRIKCLGSPHRYASAIKDGINYTSLDLSDNIKLSNTPTSYLPDAGTVLQFDYKRKPSGYSGSYHEVYVQNITASNGYNFASGSYIRITYIPQSNTYLFSTVATGGTRFRDNNGTPTLSNIEDEYGYWYIEPMDKDLETKENYFSLDPEKLVRVGDKYYTTLRTSWNILIDPERTKPYVVTSVDETAGTFEMEPITGNIIPAGTPVIIETKSNSVEANRMVPTTTAFTGTKPAINLLQTSTKYFPNQSVSGNYKALMVNGEGQLAFGGTALTTINGNEAYLQVANDVALKPIADLPTLATLKDIESTGEKGKLYTVEDGLVAVAFAVDEQKECALLWCKDQAESNAKTEMKTGQTDYMKNQYAKLYKSPAPEKWDQSNWVAVKLVPYKNVGLRDIATRLKNDVVGHVLKPKAVTGTYSDDVNYTIAMAMPEQDGKVIFENAIGDAFTYNENLYCTANFLSENLVGENGVTHSAAAEHYYFVNPKIQEVAEVTFAVWNGNYFVAPAPQEGTSTNESEINGAFNVDWRYNSYDIKTLASNKAYQFMAVVQKPVAVAGGMGLKEESEVTPMDCTPDGTYMVFPLNLDPSNKDQVITSIAQPVVSKTVSRVMYYNLMGVANAVPFQGVNIVVTEYSDGSRQARKVVMK